MNIMCLIRLMMPNPFVHPGLGSGFEPPDLDRPGRQLHQQGLCEARLGILVACAHSRSTKPPHYLRAFSLLAPIHLPK